MIEAATSFDFILNTKPEYSPLDLVSIIVPCHNRSELLRECLESIAKQTHPSIEMIIVDDASTEDLKNIILGVDWPDTYMVKYLRLSENHGQGYAREVGRQHASGAYINYQDSDDLFHPEKIALQVEMLQRHPEAGMCYCITLNFYTHPFNGTERLRGSHYIDKILPGLLEKRPWATGSCLWTRATTDAIGPWYDGRGHEDFLYEVRAGCKDIAIIYIPQILMYVRCHPGEAELRAPSIKKYQVAAIAFHEVLNELRVSGKLTDSHNLLAITRELFRVCRKLFDFQDPETALKILKHLTLVERPQSGTLHLYFFCARLILFSRHVILGRFQTIIFSKLCHGAMIVGNLSMHDR